MNNLNRQTRSCGLALVCFALMLMVRPLSAEPVSLLCDPSEPLGSWQSDESLGNLFTVSGVAYIARASGVTIIEFSDPTAPHTIATIEGSAGFTIAGVDGDRLYLYNGSQIRVLDIGDPRQPMDVTDFPFVGQILAIANAVAYAQDDKELLAYDLSQAGAGALIGTLSLDGGEPRAVQVDTNIGVVYATTGLYSVDFSDPSTMEVLAGFPPDGGTTFLVRSGDLLISSAGGLSIYDASDPLNVERVYQDAGVLRALEVVVEGNLLYIADRWFGLLVFDLVDPGSPRLVGSYPVPAAARGLALSSGAAIVRAPRDLIAFDAQPPSTPVLDARDDTQELFASSLSGDVLAVAGEDQGLLLYDMSNPLSTELFGAFESAGEVRGVIAEDQLVYVASVDRGVQVYDISDPQEPVRVGQYAVYSNVELVTKQGDTLFVWWDGATNDELHVLNVADPTRPRRIASLDPRSRPTDVAIFEDTLYVATLLDGIEISNFENPFAPEFVARMEDYDRRSLAVVDGSLVMVRGSLEIFDLAAPHAPELRATLPAETARALEIHDVVGNRVFVEREGIGSDSSQGVGIVDISDLDDPRLIAEYHLYDSVMGMDAVDARLVVSFRSSGVAVLGISEDCVPCPADLSGDGRINFVDISIFLQAYLNGEPAADFTQDGEFTFADISMFLAAFSKGCL